MHRFVAITLLASISGVSHAHATFGCAVTETSFLREAPDPKAVVVATVPAGAIVSLFNDDASITEGWARVAYSTDSEAPWGEGTMGWIRDTQLINCG